MLALFLMSNGSAGKFLLPPVKEGKAIIWITIGNGLFGGGDERGYVRANVGTLLLKFEFYNPARGANTCAALPPLYVTCTITQGVHARAMYQVKRSPLPLPDATSNQDDNSGGTQ